MIIFYFIYIYIYFHYQEAFQKMRNVLTNIFIETTRTIYMDN